MSAGYARTKPTDVSKENSAIPGELILDQVKKIVKFKHKDGRIVVIEGNNYDMFYEYLDLNFRTDTTEVHTSGKFVPRLDKSATLAKRNIVFDADMNFERLLEFGNNPANNFDRISAHITVYDKDRDQVVAIMPKVLLEDIYTLVDNGSGDIQYQNLVEILDDIDASFVDLYTVQLPKYLLTSTYTTDKATFFTKGTLNETKYPTARAMGDIIEADIKNLADNYLVKGSNLPAKYSSLKIFADDISTINTSLSDAGNIGSKLKTVYENYIPKGDSYDADYAATYATIHSIVAKMLEIGSTADTTKSNLADNYIVKGTNWASKYGTYTDMVSILDKIITVSNKTDTNTTNVSNINDFISTNVLVKGAGFNTTVYPNLLAITNKLEAIAIPDVSVFIPKGALWSTKYTTYATMYDIMEYIASIATKENAFEVTVGNTYFKYGAMTEDDKIEFPDMASVIDDIRANNTFRNAHTNTLTQMANHSKIIEYVDAEIVKAKAATSGPAKFVSLRHGGYCYGRIQGYNKPIESSPFNEDYAYAGTNAFTGIVCSTKKKAHNIGIGLFSVRKHRGFYFGVGRRMVAIADDDYRTIEGVNDTDIYTYAGVSSNDSVNNDVFCWNPIANAGNTVINYDIDMTGGTGLNVIGILGSDSFDRLLLLVYVTATATKALYVYSMATKVLSKVQDNVVTIYDADSVGSNFRQSVVAYLDANGDTVSKYDSTKGVYIDIRASYHAYDNILYYNEEGDGLPAVATLSSYSVPFNPYSSATVTLTVKDGSGNPVAANVTVMCDTSGITIDGGYSGTTIAVPASGTKTITLANQSTGTGTATLSIGTVTPVVTNTIYALASQSGHNNTILCGKTITNRESAYTVTVEMYTGIVKVSAYNGLKDGLTYALSHRGVYSSLLTNFGSNMTVVGICAVTLYSCIVYFIDPNNNNKLYADKVTWDSSGAITSVEVLTDSKYTNIAPELDVPTGALSEEYENREFVVYSNAIKTANESPHEYFLVKFKA